MVKILVSACLLGERCRYDGSEDVWENVVKYLEGKEYITICPELLGGLETPRHPCEMKNERVINRIGEDVTIEFDRGAQKVLAIAKENQCTLAILKSRSPSCGSNEIYDGNFSHKIISGDGICARLLKANGIKVISEEDLDI